MSTSNIPTHLAAEITVREMLRTAVSRSCFNCANFDKKADFCDKFHVRPPAEIVIFSCGNDWEFDIPF